MNPAQRTAWERTRAKGKWRFVLIQGVALWGTLMFVLQTFVMRLWQPQRDPLSVAGIALSALVWAAAGVAFGLLLWWWLERLYRRNS